MKRSIRGQVLDTLSRSTDVEFSAARQSLADARSQVEQEAERLAREQRALELTRQGNRGLMAEGMLINPAVLMAGEQSRASRTDAVERARSTLSNAEAVQQLAQSEADRLQRRLDKLDEFSSRESSRLRAVEKQKDQIAADELALHTSRGRSL